MTILNIPKSGKIILVLHTSAHRTSVAGRGEGRVLVIDSGGEEERDAGRAKNGEGKDENRNSD